MYKETPQEEAWRGTFGKEYANRNSWSCEKLDALYERRYGISRTGMNGMLTRYVPPLATILEVGCGDGVQLALLYELGYTELFGLDISTKQAERATELHAPHIVATTTGSVLDIPAYDSSYEVVFTSGLLIHVSPEDLVRAMDEMYRVSRRFIWGFEYFSIHLEPESVVYRGIGNMLWKANYAELFLQRFPALRLVEERRYKYLEEGLEQMDTMYLLEKEKANETGDSSAGCCARPYQNESSSNMPEKVLL